MGWILEYLPQLQTKRIISPFFGGGSVELVLASLGYQIKAYDVFNLLTNFWSILKYQPRKLVDELEKLIPDKDNFTHNRHILLNYWNKIKPNDLNYKTRNEIQLTIEEQNLLDNDPIKQATYYYYNHQLSYGPMFLGWNSSVYLNNKKYKNMLAKLLNTNLKNIDISCASFEEVIPHYKHDFLFLDPPYYDGEDSKLFKPLYPNCNFPIHHRGFNHELLRNLLAHHQGGFIMTYNDCSTIREWYANYQLVIPKWQYTYGQGETRMGDNRTDTNIKESHEIIIIAPPIYD